MTRSSIIIRRRQVGFGFGESGVTEVAKGLDQLERVHVHRGHTLGESVVADEVAEGHALILGTVRPRMLLLRGQKLLHAWCAVVEDELDAGVDVGVRITGWVNGSAESLDHVLEPLRSVSCQRRGQVLARPHDVAAAVFVILVTVFGAGG